MSHLRLSDATATLEANPAALSRALQDARDSYTALRKNNPSPASLDAEDARFWASLGDQPAAVQLQLTAQYLEALGEKMLARDREILAAASIKAKQTADARKRDMERVRQNTFAAQATRGLRSAMQGLRRRLELLDIELSKVAEPADLVAWSQDFENALNAAHTSMAVEMAPPSPAEAAQGMTP
jgi:hypothetical protein